MPHSHDDLWNRDGRQPARDEPTIQIQRVAKRRPERTRTHHVVAREAQAPAADDVRRRRSDDGTRAGRRDDRQESWSSEAFRDFDDLRDVTRSQPAITDVDDLFDDFVATGSHSLAFDDASFDDGAYRDARYVDGDDHFGPRFDDTTVMRVARRRDQHGAAGHDDRYDDDHTAEALWVEPARRRRTERAGVLASIDPRLLSVGAVALASVLAVPLIGSLTDDGGAAQMRSVTEAAVVTTLAPPTSSPAPVVTIEQAAAAPAGEQAAQPGADTSGGASSSADSSSSGSSGSGDASAAGQPADASSGAGGSSGTAATADAPAASSRFPDSAGLPAPSQRARGHCGNAYEVQQGDFWARLANATGMSVDDFVAYNNATIDTTIHPGDIVCLPLGTSISVPTTAAPAPATTAPAQQPSSTAPSTTQAQSSQSSNTGSSTGSSSTSSAPPQSTQAPSTTSPSQPASSEPPRGVWDDLAKCESSGNWSINTGNGYYGGLQFTLSSWRAVGGTGYPHENSRAEQIKRAEMLLEIQGWRAWPTCSSRLGLR